MWAETISIRSETHKVGVRTDSRTIARDVRRLFKSSIVEGSERAPSNFSVIRPSVVRRRRGRLFFGGEELARSLRRRPLLEALQTYVASIRDPGSHIPVDMRVFRRDDRVVLTDALRPSLMNSEALSRAGIAEQLAWRAWVNDDGSSVDVPRRDGTRETLPLVGMVAVAQADGEPDAKSTCGRALGNYRQWIAAVAMAKERGELLAYSTDVECTDAIVKLLR